MKYLLSFILFLPLTCLDSSLLGIEGTAQFIVEFVKRRLSE